MIKFFLLYTYTIKLNADARSLGIRSILLCKFPNIFFVREFCARCNPFNRISSDKMCTYTPYNRYVHRNNTRIYDYNIRPPITQTPSPIRGRIHIQGFVVDRLGSSSAKCTNTHTHTHEVAVGILKREREIEREREREKEV
jgi:hypothetical protein